MRFECDSSALAKACGAVQRTVSNKSVIPALEGILINAEDGKIFLTGYDLDVGTETEIEASVSENGKALLNAKHLCDILRMIPGERVTIDSDDRSICKIRSEETNYKLIGINPEDFPEMPTVSGSESIVINQGLLKDMIRRVIFAVSVSERNPVHCGVKFEIADGKIVLVAVDGSRLSVRRESIDFYGDPISFVVPAKALNEIMRLSDDDEENYIISVGHRHILIQTGNYKTTSRLLEGHFIDYRATIPAQFSTKTIVDVQSTIECIERTSLIITDRSSHVKLKVEGGTLTFSCSTQVGTATDVMRANVEGAGIEIGFNNKFLLDALRASSDDEVYMNFVSESKPIVILPKDGESFLHLVLPVRI